MLARFPLDVVSLKPGIVILMGGTNDLWYDLDANLILANLSAMVNQANSMTSLRSSACRSPSVWMR